MLTVSMYSPFAGFLDMVMRGYMLGLGGMEMSRWG